MIGRLKFDLESKANELLDDIPESEFISTTSTWCDPEMGGGQIVKAIEDRLKKYGHSEKNIKSRVFGYESTDLRINYARNKHNLIGTYKEGEPNGMKFDNITTNSNWASDGADPDRPMSGVNVKLWQLALDSYINELLNDGGNLAYICPGTWCQGKKNPVNNTNILNDIIKTYNTKTIKTDVKEKCFPKVGHKVITSFVLNKTKTYPNEVKINDKNITNFQDWNVIPSNRLTQEILMSKIFNDYDKFDFQFVRKSFSFKEARETKSAIYSNKTYLGTKGFLYVKEKTKFDNLPKVLIYRMSNAGFVADDVGEITPSYSSVCLLKEKEEGKNLVKLFESELYTFLMSTIKQGQYWEASLFNLFPKLDLTKEWTDDMIYNELSISDDIRKQIGSFKK
jgi:hypothetical protein